MSKPIIIRFKVSVAWWLRPYLHVLAFFCTLMDAEPKWERLHRIAIRAIRVKPEWH